MPEAWDPPGDGVIGACDPLDAGTELRSSITAVHALNCLNVFYF